MENNTNKHDNINELCVEITYYPDTMPQIKSYYIMSPNEYEDLKSLYIDVYIDDFINNEDLTKDKLDIHLVQNINNITIFKKFIELFGNPFDIINLINIKKNLSAKNNTNNEILENNFSEHESSEDDNSGTSNEFLENKNKKNNETDSDEYIDTMTEIIDTYNKSKKIDESKIQKLIQDKPELKYDMILSELQQNK